MTYKANADLEFREGWFEEPAISMPPSRVPARTAVCALGGAAVGALASAPIFAGASWLAEHMEGTAERITAGAGFSSPYAAFIAVSVLGGALGAILGVMMMYSARLRARLIFAPVFSVVLYLFVHALLLSRGWLTLPLVPMLGAAFVYGLCLACAPPLRRGEQLGKE